MALYSETTSFHRDTYGKVPGSNILTLVSKCIDIREAFLEVGCLLHRMMQMASTTLLLLGREAQEPPDKKHLLTL